MTCIVGVTAGDKVWMGCDSLAGTASGWNVEVRADRKMFARDGILVGFTYSYRMGQLLAHKLSVPSLPSRRAALDWMVTELVESVRTCLSDGGWMQVEKQRESAGQFLVGVQGRLFRVDVDHAVAELSCGFDSVGCGESFALGALAATRRAAPKTRVLTALRAASEMSGGVGGPLHVSSISERKT